MDDETVIQGFSRTLDKCPSELILRMANLIKGNYPEIVAMDSDEAREFMKRAVRRLRT